MGRVMTGRCLVLAGVACLLAVALHTPALAQQLGMIRGKVVDSKGQPIEGAKITFESSEGGRKFEGKTNKKGEFVQIGLVSGTYTVTAEKEGIGKQSTPARVSIGTPTEVNFQLSAAAADDHKATVRKGFDEGVALNKAGDYDGAIAKFTETSNTIPNCFDCLAQIGFAYSQKKQFTEAEAAYKKAIEMKPDYAAAYNGLATVYNAQKKFDEAAAASAKAVEYGGAAPGSGGADAMYNQGVIFWNQGKIAEAKKQFEDVLKADPNHADAHYQLGMALVNEGKLPEAIAEFEQSLTLAPNGPHAAQAKALLGQLKK
jgi:tetratricopeptide (TPR) repeat protein